MTHADRLARLGSTGWKRLLVGDGVKAEDIHEKGAARGMPDLLDDSMPPAVTCARRTCGVGSVAATLSLLGRVNDTVELARAS